MSGSPVQRRRALAALFIGLLALSQGLLWYAYYGHGAKALIGDEQVYQETALSILLGGAWMPGTIWPPLQPLLMAATYAVFGSHLLSVQVLQTLLFFGCAALLRDLWRHLGGSVAAANLAAALFLLNPANAAYAQWLWPEIPHLFLLLAVFCLLARVASPVRAFAAGAGIGLAMLAKSLLSAFWPAFLLVFLRRERPFVRVRHAALCVLGMALVTAPALLHGWRETGRPMIADSSIYNLWVGLGDRWRSDYVADMGGVTLPAFLASGSTPQERNAVYLDKVQGLVADRGVVTLLGDQLSRQYFRLFSAKTPLVSQLPGAACAGHLSVYRSPPWLTRTLVVLNDSFHVLMLVAAAFGIACWRRLNRPMVLVLLFFAYQLALFMVLHVKARFLFPMVPFLCGFAGSFLSSVWSGRVVASVARHPSLLAGGGIVPTTLQFSPQRLIAGASLAALLLFLAFAGPVLDHLCAG